MMNMKGKDHVNLKMDIIHKLELPLFYYIYKVIVKKPLTDSKLRNIKNLILKKETQEERFTLISSTFINQSI